MYICTDEIVCLYYLSNIILKVQLQEAGPTLDKEVEAFFLTMLRVQAQRPDSLTVLIMALVFTTVPTLKTLESPANLLEPLPHLVS